MKTKTLANGVQVIPIDEDTKLEIELRFSKTSETGANSYLHAKASKLYDEKPEDTRFPITVEAACLCASGTFLGTIYIEGLDSPAERKAAIEMTEAVFGVLPWN